MNYNLLAKALKDLHCDLSNAVTLLDGRVDGVFVNLDGDTYMVADASKRYHWYYLICSVEQFKEAAAFKKDYQQRQY